MRFHVLGIPHTVTAPEWCGCAFTQKVAKFLKMMAGRGHQLIHYGHADSQLFQHPDIEHVTVTNNKLFRQAYGDYDWKTNGFAHYYNTTDAVYRTYYERTIRAIEKRKQPHDFVLCFWGWGHKPVADAFPDLIVVEPGIGYPAQPYARWQVYESHAIMNAAYGIQAVEQCLMDWYRVVIPNYFDPEDFTYNPVKSDYVLFLGRIGYGKGVHIAIEATEKAGKQLIVAGQGTLAQMGYQYIPEHVTEVGYADPELRRRLLSNAEALFIASGYLEPFGGVQVEAWLSGTPVISPDWGAFAEYNREALTGFKCRTFKDFVVALNSLGLIDPARCLDEGVQFTLDNVAPLYERYFQDVLDTYTGKGWYQL